MFERKVTMRWQRSKWQNSEAFPERPHRDLRLLCSTGSGFFRPESSRRRSPETGASSQRSRCESGSIRLMLSGRGRCSRSRWRPTGPSRGQHRWSGNKMNPVGRLLLSCFTKVLTLIYLKLLETTNSYEKTKDFNLGIVECLLGKWEVRRSSPFFSV